jgi:hypothetical protein
MQSFTNSHRQFVGRTFCCTAAALLLIASLTGCGPGGSASASNAPTGASNDNSAAAANPNAKDNRTADQILKDMASTYAKAKSYADEGQVRRVFTRNGQRLEQDFNFSVAFERPNKLRLICYDAMVVSDGQKFRAAVKTIPNLVLEVPAPTTMSPDNVVEDPQLRAALQGPGGAPVQIAFLMSENTLGQLLQSAMQPPKLLQPEPIDNRRCNRVEIDSSEGVLTLWIDSQTNLIRRIELPTRESKLELDQEGAVTDVALSIELSNAQVDKPVPAAAFKFEIPQDAKIVDSLVEAINPAAILPATEPTSFKLSKLWDAEGLKDPGNILVVDNNGTPRIFAIEGWRTVVELNDKGKVVATHDLGIPETAVVNYLRTAVDAQGKRCFVAAGNGQPQLFVFDENWKRVADYPKADANAAQGVWDVQVADLKGNGKPELCVGYWGDTGVQGATLAGEKLWSDRSVQFVFRMATTEPDAAGHRHLLATHNRGTIVSFDCEGKRENEITIPNRNVYYIVSDDLDGKGKNSYCGLSGTATGENTAVGFALDGKELWSYPLPAGVHRRPVEVIAAADVDGQTKDWLFAGPDGSIHMVNGDGKAIDKFNTGSALAGLDAAKMGEARVLLVSKVLEKPNGDVKGALEAWLVEPATK